MLIVFGFYSGFEVISACVCGIAMGPELFDWGRGSVHICECVNV